MKKYNKNSQRKCEVCGFYKSLKYYDDYPNLISYRCKKCVQQSLDINNKKKKSKNSQRKCKICGVYKSLKYYDNYPNLISYRCKKCTQQSLDIYNKVKKSKKIEVAVEYRTDIRIEEIGGKTHVIIPSIA